MIKPPGAIVLIHVLGLLGCAAGGGSPSSPAGAQPVVTVSQINASRDTYVGDVIGVRGQIVVEELQSAGAGPCNTVTGAGCNPVALTRLHLVEAGRSATDANRVDLYRRTPSGTYEPAGCKILGPGSYDCSPYTPGSVAVVVGTFTKHAEPTQQVIYPDGRAVAIQSRDIYFLVVP